MKRPIKLTAD